MLLLVVTFKIKILHIGFMQVLIIVIEIIKTYWNILIVNCITDSCIWNTCVTWQGTDYKLPNDDTILSKHVGGV